MNLFAQTEMPKAYAIALCLTVYIGLPSVCCLIGTLVGARKKIKLAGAIFGLLLGPIGIMLLFSLDLDELETPATKRLFVLLIILGILLFTFWTCILIAMLELNASESQNFSAVENCEQDSRVLERISIPLQDARLTG